MASPQARAAVRAAKNFNRWGGKAACRYAEKHGVSEMMFTIAIRLEVRRLARREAATQYEAAVRIEAMERRAAA